MNIILWTLLVIAAFSVIFVLAVLIILGSPRATEPRFIKALRFNMWAETLGMIGYGLLHPRLWCYRSTRSEKKMAFPEYRKDVSPWGIHLEWQSLEVGDVFMDGDALDQCSENKGAWRVREVDDQKSIVLFSARDFLEGIEFDPQLTRPKKIYGITSWVFYIRPIDEEQSRLLIRVRVELGPDLLKIIAWLVFGTGDAVFEQTTLEGIKSRVENFSTTKNQSY